MTSKTAEADEFIEILTAELHKAADDIYRYPIHNHPYYGSQPAYRVFRKRVRMMLKQRSAVKRLRKEMYLLEQQAKLHESFTVKIGDMSTLLGK